MCVCVFGCKCMYVCVFVCVCVSVYVCVCVAWLLNDQAAYKVYFKEGSAQTTVRAATLRWKLLIKLAISPGQGKLTPGKPA